jgi:hypothetical protein
MMSAFGGVVVPVGRRQWSGYFSETISRVSQMATDVRKVIAPSGLTVSANQARHALSDLYKWLHTDVFHYRSSTLAITYQVEGTEKLKTH